jgi:glutathione S-transferase
MQLPVLVQMSVSPWSEKARWALDHHRIAYRTETHTPLADEPKLRLRLRRLRGVASVPVLIVGRQAIEGSLAIAAWADAHGQGAPLCALAEVEAWNARSDRILSLGRARVVRSMLASRPALIEAVPSFVPASLRSALMPVAALGTWFVQQKYRVDVPPTALDDEIARELELARATLADGARYVLGEFSFADIALAAALQVVAPVVSPAYPLGAATREAWTSAPLCERFSSLVAWRDALYERVRIPETKAERA